VVPCFGEVEEAGEVQGADGEYDGGRGLRKPQKVPIFAEKKSEESLQRVRGKAPEGLPEPEPKYLQNRCETFVGRVLVKADPAFLGGIIEGSG
jgi:hypothetical protein